MRGLVKARSDFNPTATLSESWHQRLHHQRVQHKIPMLASPSANRLLSQLSHSAIYATHGVARPQGFAARLPVGEIYPHLKSVAIQRANQKFSRQRPFPLEVVCFELSCILDSTIEVAIVVAEYSGFCWFAMWLVAMQDESKHESCR